MIPGGLSVHLRLGRCSNLPTVWSNVLGAAVVAGAIIDTASLLLAMLACSAMYIGGMYLNDACDADIDADERPERPIPAGLISRRQVYAFSAGWFMLGLLCFAGARSVAVGILPTDTGQLHVLQGIGWVMGPAALLGCIIAYNHHHKGNPYGPLLMAACRALVYVSVGLVLTPWPGALLVLAATLSFLWIMGLTALAKRESVAASGTGVANGMPRPGLADWPLLVLAAPAVTALAVLDANLLVLLLCLLLAGIIYLARERMRAPGPGSFGQAIGVLIAGVSIVDAVVIAGLNLSGLALLAALCFPLTLLLQRYVSGT